MKTDSFRDDINALRALAVLAVLLFHFEFQGFEGGFVGVDVFFVISGFLMTSIISRKIADESFKAIDFYLDRAFRIMPALAVVCLAVFIFAYFFLPPTELKPIGKHIGSSLTFVSNVVYSTEGNYFDPGAGQKWLLHTWSLSAEWQFYLIYPLLLISSARLLGVQRVRIVLVVTCLISLAYCVSISGTSQRSAFYLLPSRAWEMLLGGVVYFFPLRISKNKAGVLAASGLCATAFSIAFFTASDVWPGWRALVPACGAAAVIAAGTRGFPVLSSAPVQWIGKISYSIYLWHWPLVVGLSYLDLQENLLAKTSFLIASLCMGWISYVLVETKAAKLRVRSIRTVGAVRLGLPYVFLLAGASLAYISGGFIYRASPEYMALVDRMSMPSIRNGWCFYSVDTISSLEVGEKGLQCKLGEKVAAPRLKGLLFGDSFAGHVEPFWDEIAKVQHLQIDSVTTNWCFPTTEDDYGGPVTSRAYPQCKFNRKYFQDKVGTYDFVILAGQWGHVHTMGRLSAAMGALDLSAKQTKLVVVMEAPMRYDTDLASSYLRAQFIGRPFDVGHIETTSDAIPKMANAEISNYARKYGNVLVFKRESMYLADGMESRTTVSGQPFASDTNHISIAGAIASAKEFQKTSAYADFVERLNGIAENTAGNRTRGIEGLQK